MGSFFSCRRDGMAWAWTVDVAVNHATWRPLVAHVDNSTRPGDKRSVEDVVVDAPCRWIERVHP